MNNKIDKAGRRRDGRGMFVKGNDKYITRPHTSKELEMIKEFEAKRSASKCVLN